MKSKQRKLAKIMGEINAGLGRIKNSSSESALEDCKDSFQSLLQLAHSLVAFQSAVLDSSPEPETFMKLKNDLIQRGVTIGPTYCQFELVLRGRQAMMRNDAASLCVLCLVKSPSMQVLLDGGSLYSFAHGRFCIVLICVLLCRECLQHWHRIRYSLGNGLVSFLMFAWALFGATAYYECLQHV